MTEIVIRGLAELQKMLDAIPAKLEANIMRGALREGAKVIEAQAKANAPVGPPSAEGVKLYGHYRGALRDSIRVSTRIRNKKGMVTASVKAGGKNKKTGADVWYAHIIEFTGAVPHIIKGVISTKKGFVGKGKSGLLSFYGIFRRSVQHPGMQAKPFMRPAIDQQATAAVVATAEYIKRRFTKDGLNAADVEISTEDNE